MNIGKIILLAALLPLVACTGRNARPGSGEQTYSHVAKKFTVPDPPTYMTEPGEMGTWLSVHYWDNFDFADTSYLSMPEYGEQAFANFLYILGNLPQKDARNGIAKLMDKVVDNEDAYYYFAEQFEKYLYDPNSPMRNEEFYLLFVEYVLGSDKLDEISKLRPRAQYGSILTNRVGTRAADFTIIDRSGREIRMASRNTPYRLLFFNNPDCHACHAIARDLASSELLNTHISAGNLTVMAVYPDNDLEIWKSHRNDFPSTWIDGYVKGQKSAIDGIYDLRAIPTMYLLGKDGVVLIKDSDNVEQIEYYIANRFRDIDPVTRQPVVVD